MDFDNYVRKPFSVEAVQITNENIAEIAEYVGVLKEKSNGTPYIQVDRNKVPNVFRVYPGSWMTKMGDQIRCYSKRAFSDQFLKSSPEIQEVVAVLNGIPVG